MVTVAQLQEGIRRADAAGDTNGVRVLGQQLLAMRQPQAAPAKPASFWQGLEMGAAKPLYNLAQYAQSAADALGIRKPLEAFGHLVDFGQGAVPGPGGVAAARQHYLAQQAAKPTRPSATGQFVGNLIGTAPTMMLPGGILAQGAASGALLTDKPTDPLQVAQDALTGAVGAKLGSVALKGIARVAAPQVSKSLAALKAALVRPSVGQAARTSGSFVGKVIGNLEDRANSLPIVGTMINNARSAGIDDFNRAPIQQVLGTIGQSLPDDVATGHDAVAHTQQALSDFYKQTLAKMQLIPDNQMGEELRSLMGNAQNGGLDAPHFDRLTKIITNGVVRRFNNGALSGDALQSALSDIGKQAADYGGSSVASEREFGSALGDLHDILENAAARSSDPAAAADLSSANNAYAHLVRIEGAAKGTPDGVYTPGQLNTAVRMADSSVRKRAVAAGQGLMQDYAKAGVDVLGNKLPDSGTASRSMTWNPIPWGIGAAASIPYKAAQIASPLLTRTPGPIGSLIGQNLNAAAPYLGMTIPPLLLAPPNQ